MNDEYVDITSQEFHDSWKKRYMAIQIIRFCLNLFMIIGIVCTMMIMAPYMTGEKELEEVPLSLSQLETIICGIFLVRMMEKIHF